MVVYLEEYLKSGDYFMGMDNGKEVKKKLGLDKIDKTDEKVEFIISFKIRGISDLFFIGLFEKSVKKFDVKKFKEKYIFKCEDSDMQDLIDLEVRIGIKESKVKLGWKKMLFGIWDRKI